MLGIIVIVLGSATVIYMAVTGKRSWKAVLKMPSKQPKVELNTGYKNPFDQNTQYVNPFDKTKNPFHNL